MLDPTGGRAAPADPLLAAIMQALMRKRVPPARDPSQIPVGIDNDLVYRPTPQQVGAMPSTLQAGSPMNIGGLLSAILQQRPQVPPQQATKLGGIFGAR